MEDGLHKTIQLIINIVAFGFVGFFFSYLILSLPEGKIIFNYNKVGEMYVEMAVLPILLILILFNTIMLFKR